MIMIRKSKMHKDIKEIIFSEEQLIQRSREIGEQITKDFEGEEVLLVGILRGSILFFADVMRNIDLDCKIDFMGVKSYDGTVSKELTITKDLSENIEGKNIILVKDILDTGKTLAFIKRELAKRNPKSISICTLLDKKIEKSEEVKAQYIGFEVDNVFVVGYGLDYSQKYRNLPYIGVIKEEAI